MAVVDANYKYNWLNIGINGTASDGQIWNNSDLKLGMFTDRIHLPQPDPFPGDTANIPHLFFSSLVMIPLLWKSSS